MANKTLNLAIDAEQTFNYKWPNQLYTHFHLQHGTKTNPVFLYTDGEGYCLLIPFSVLAFQPENIYSSILEVTGHSDWEKQKG